MRKKAIVFIIIAVLSSVEAKADPLWAHDCGGYGTWANVWDAMHSYDNGTSCRNHTDYFYGGAGHCHTARYNNGGVAWETTMDCQTNTSCTVYGSMTCNGVKNTYNISCTATGSAVAAKVDATGADASCQTVNSSGQWVTSVDCSCDGQSIYCSIYP